MPLQPGIQGTSALIREAYSTLIFPRLMAFEPDFILVSAGFDAHYLDHLHRQGET